MQLVICSVPILRLDNGPNLIANHKLRYPEEHDTIPRIWHRNYIEHDGSVIGGADSASVSQVDFILPSDESSQQALYVRLDYFDLTPITAPANPSPTKSSSATLGNPSTAPRIQTYSARMTFSVQLEQAKEERQINLPLRYDVRFVTAHPCIASPHTITRLLPFTVTSSQLPDGQVPVAHAGTLF